MMYFGAFPSPFLARLSVWGQLIVTQIPMSHVKAGAAAAAGWPR